MSMLTYLYYIYNNANPNDVNKYLFHDGTKPIWVNLNLSDFIVFPNTNTKFLKDNGTFDTINAFHTNVNANNNYINNLKDPVLLQDAVTKYYVDNAISNIGPGQSVWSVSGTDIYYNNGNVAIGDTPDSNIKLYVNGNILATNEITAYGIIGVSDKNLKKNIQKLNNSIDTITNLNPVTFNWINNNNKDAGFIAQEVEQVNPLLVADVYDPISKKNIKGVKYDKIIPYLVDTIQQLLLRVSVLESELQN